MLNGLDLIHTRQTRSLLSLESESPVTPHVSLFNNIRVNN